MTTTSPAPPRTRQLRRSRTDRVGAGVAGGLGSYFGLDPVLFRVLFATAAFFGGAGILAYLLAWAAIPEEGTEHAPIDNWIRELRRRRVPFWVVAVLAGLVLWTVAFSWWAPGPFFPVLAVVVLLTIAVTRSSRRASSRPTEPVSLVKAPDADGRPAWVQETRNWIEESKAASRIRARRALPVKIATLSVLALTLLVLGLVDAATGIAIPVYFLVSGGILVLGLLIGLGLRRAPWSITSLLVPAVAGVIAFGGSHARLHDGVGEHTFAPTTSLASHYQQGLGKVVLDLRSLTPPTEAQDVRVDLGAGQVQILVPSSLNVTVQGHVHIGAVKVDGAEPEGGWNYVRTVDPPSGATGAPITIRVYVTDGLVQVDR